MDRKSPEMFALSVITVNSDKTRDSIVGTATSRLQLFVKSKSLSKMLESDEVDYEGIAGGKTAVFVVTPDENKHMDPLVSIFVSDLYTYLVDAAAKRESCSLEHKVNFIMDEFANFPRIDSMPTMLSASRSRNIRFMLCVQSLSQLRSTYEADAETIKGSAMIWVYLNSKDLKTLEEISDLSGSAYSTTFLQRMNLGQALVMHDRLPPRLTELSDIDSIPHDKIAFKVPEREPSQYEKEAMKLERMRLEDGPVKEVLGKSVASIVSDSVLDEVLDADTIANRLLKNLLFGVSDISSVGLRRYLSEHKDEFYGCSEEICKAYHKVRS